jgi:RimJ/RimL family protein N-acetyltransferase
VSETLTTPRLVLREMAMADAVQLYDVFSDAETMKYFADTHLSLRDTEKWVASTINAPKDETRDYTIFLNGQIIGKAGIWEAPELGFLIHRKHWGQGLAFEALTTLLPHLHRTLWLKKITADVDPRNSASLRLLTRLGFHETHRAVHTLHINGAWCDSIYMAHVAD